MAGSEEEVQVRGFCDPTLLNKIDELRRLNISSMVPLPQLVVVGDQSAGKSSVLEGLTGLPFPRAVNLCTRYATEIICRRDDAESITASIRPAPGSSSERAIELQEFRAELPTKDRNSKKLQDVFYQASIAMGLRLEIDASGPAPAFSEDVLRIEITGPKEDLAIIDVPGIFGVPTPGVTGKSDISLVNSMVMNYIQEPRTIILAVIPCTADIATQQILERAEEVDPEGNRTIGVLTKPDLLTEKAAKEAVVDLVKGNRWDLQLGYFVVRNRGADDLTSDLAQRNYVERAFFGESPWNQLDKARLGIRSLRSQLRELLSERIRHGFPKVKRDLAARLEEKKRKLRLMGQPRENTDQQRAYLGRIAAEFSDIGRYALEAFYTGHKIFSQNPELHLATRIQEISEAFAQELFTRGHYHEFQRQGEVEARTPITNDNEDVDTSPYRNEIYEISFTIPDEEYFPEISVLLAEPFFCPNPIKRQIMSCIRKVYLKARGQEVGAFGNFVLSATFKEQSRSWKGLTMAHISNAVLIVHHFVENALVAGCPDEKVRYELRTFLMDDLLDCYRRAIKHAEFLLRIECEGKAITSNPQFTELLIENRRAREYHRVAELSRKGGFASADGDRVIPQHHIETAIFQSSDVVGQICSDIHDVLEAYYEVARSRFVDGVYQQAIDHFLLNDDKSALRVFTPERVLSMSSEELRSIAEEDPSSRRARQKLEREIAILEEAIEVLRI